MEASLARSHSASDLPIWEELYRNAFPDFAAMVDHRQDGEHQRAGIDRSIILTTSKQYLVDEKARGRNKKTGKIYTDILLEYLSDEERGIPGWVCKPLRADYIAYAIVPLGRAYLLPVVQLQAAWKVNGKKWIEYAKDRNNRQFSHIRAFNRDGNRTWTTVSVGVPVSVLFPEIGRMLRVRFAPHEFVE